MRWLIAIALIGCACPTKQAGTSTTTGSGSVVGSGAGSASGRPCEIAAVKVEALYRAEPKASDEVVADNTAMVIAECKRAPERVSGCLAEVTTVHDLEAKCMPQLDEEGSEADVLVR